MEPLGEAADIGHVIDDGLRAGLFGFEVLDELVDKDEVEDSIGHTLVKSGAWKDYIGSFRALERLPEGYFGASEGKS
jgi:hypothetical protein